MLQKNLICSFQALAIGSIRRTQPLHGRKEYIVVALLLMQLMKLLLKPTSGGILVRFRSLVNQIGVQFVFVFGKIGLRVIDDTFHIGSDFFFGLLIQCVCGLFQIITKVGRKCKIHIVQIVDHRLKGLLLFCTFYGQIQKPCKMEAEVIAVAARKGIEQPEQNGLFLFDDIQLLSDGIPVLCIRKAAQKGKLFLLHSQMGSFLLRHLLQRGLWILEKNCADGLYRQPQSTKNCHFFQQFYILLGKIPIAIFQNLRPHQLLIHIIFHSFFRQTANFAKRIQLHIDHLCR